MSAISYCYNFQLVTQSITKYRNVSEYSVASHRNQSVELLIGMFDPVNLFFLVNCLTFWSRNFTFKF